MSDLRGQIASVAADKNAVPVYHGTLADDYDGLHEFVYVALSRGSASAALARVAAGATGAGQATPAGTPVSVVSINGHLEVLSLGTRLNTDYVITTTDAEQTTGAEVSAATLVVPNVQDFTGVTIVGQAGLEGSARRLAQAGGLYNSDFEIPPVSMNADISSENTIPYWEAVATNGFGTYLQVVESEVSLGKVLRCLINPSRDALSDYFWVGQTLVCNVAQTITVTGITGPSVSSSYILDITLDWLSADPTDLTLGGTLWVEPALIRRDGGGVVVGATPGIGPNTLFSFTYSTDYPPPNARYLRIWVGIRATSSDTLARYFDIVAVSAKDADSKLRIPDAYISTQDNSGEIYTWNRALILKANEGGAAGIQPELHLDGDTPGIFLYPKSGGRAAFDPETFGNNSTATCTVTSAGTYYTMASQLTAGITPAFAGQRFLCLGSVSVVPDLAGIVTARFSVVENDGTTVDTTLGYARHEGAATNEYGHLSFVGIYTATDTNAKRFRPYYTHSVNGAVITAYYLQLIMMPLPF